MVDLTSNSDHQRPLFFFLVILFLCRLYISSDISSLLRRQDLLVGVISHFYLVPDGRPHP